LTAEQIASAQKLLADASADGSMFSYTGIYTLIDELKKLGINLGIDPAKIQIPAANLVTEWATLENKLATNLTSAVEMLQKATSGMELDEALSLAKRADMDFAADF
jgi:hypothetical protein